MALMTLGRIPTTTRQLNVAIAAASEHVIDRDLMDPADLAVFVLDTPEARQALTDQLDSRDTELAAVKDELARAKEELANARKNLLDSLTPWIPGDFLVAYGVLLTVWTSIRSSFTWLLIVASLSAIVFVFGAAFAASGFKQATWRETYRPLTLRAVLGGLVAVYAAIAIPNSGWYEFSWFANNETQWLMTASSVLIVPIVFVLKGAQQRTGIKLTA